MGSPSTSKYSFNPMRPEYLAITAFYVYLVFQERVIGTWFQTMVVVLGGAIVIKLGFMILRGTVRFLRWALFASATGRGQAMRISLAMVLVIVAMDGVCIAVAMAQQPHLSTWLDSILIGWIILTAPFAIGAFSIFLGEINDALLKDQK